MTEKEALQKSITHHEENLKLMEGAKKVYWNELDQSYCFVWIMTSDGKWRKVSYDGKRCALCRIHFTLPKPCSGCILNLLLGSCSKPNHPWKKMSDSLYFQNLPKAIKAEKELIALMKELLLN